MPGTERASTVLFENIDRWKNRSGFDESITYGTSGTPTARSAKSPRPVGRRLRHRAVCVRLAAVAYAFLPFVAPGDHVLIPQRLRPGQNTGQRAAQTDVTVEQYDPLVGCRHCRPDQTDTRLVWVETPGSITMEVSDLPAIAAAAHAAGALVAIDNTCSAGWYLRAFELGADISVHALTKVSGRAQ